MAQQLIDGPLLSTLIRYDGSNRVWRCVDNNQQCRFFGISPTGFTCATETVKGNPIPTLAKTVRPLTLPVPDYQCPYRPYSE